MLVKKDLEVKLGMLRSMSSTPSSSNLNHDSLPFVPSSEPTKKSLDASNNPKYASSHHEEYYLEFLGLKGRVTMITHHTSYKNPHS
jgi:hypothetical protein